MEKKTYEMPHVKAVENGIKRYEWLVAEINGYR